MADHSQPDDIASLAEQLWGPREEETTAGISTAPAEELWGPRGHDSPASLPSGRGAKPSSRPAAAPASEDAPPDRVHELEQRIRSKMAQLVQILKAQHAAVVDRTTSDFLNLRAEVEAWAQSQAASTSTAVDARLAAAEARIDQRVEAMAQRLADAEAGLGRRLEELTDHLTRAAGPADVDRLALLEQQVRDAMGQLGQWAETLQTSAVSRNELEATQRELGAMLEERLFGVREEALQATSAHVAQIRAELAEQLAEGAGAAGDQASRFTAELVAVRDDVEAALVQRVDRAMAEMAQAVGSVASPSQEEAERLAAIEARLAGSVGRDELASLRSELQAALVKQVDRVAVEATRAAERGVAGVRDDVAREVEGVRSLVADVADMAGRAAGGSAPADSEQLGALSELVRRDVAGLVQSLESIRARLAEAVPREELHAFEAQLLAQVHDEVERLAASLGGTQATAVSTAELEAGLDRVRSETAEAVAAAAGGLDAAQAGVRDQLQRLAEQMEAAITAVASSAELEAERLATIEAGLASSVSRDELASLRSELEAAMGQARSDAAGVVRALVEAAEADVDQRLDSMAAQLAEVAAGRGADADTAPRAAIEQLFERLAAVEGRQEASIGGDEVVSLRAELEAAVGHARSEAAGVARSLLEAAEADLDLRLRALVDQVAEASQRAAAASDLRHADASRLAAVERRLDSEAAGGAGAVSAADVAELRSHVDTVVAHQLAGLRAEVLAASEHGAGLGQRVDDIAAKVESAVAVGAALTSSAQGDARRLTALRRDLHDRLARLAEQVESSAGETVAKADFGALRSELDAALAQHVAWARSEVESRLAAVEAVAASADARLDDRLSEVVERVSAQAAEAVAQASAEASTLAPLRSDIWVLGQELSAVTRAVQELRESKVRPRRKATPSPIEALASRAVAALHPRRPPEPARSAALPAPTRPPQPSQRTPVVKEAAPAARRPPAESVPTGGSPRSSAVASKGAAGRAPAKKVGATRKGAKVTTPPKAAQAAKPAPGKAGAAGAGTATGAKRPAAGKVAAAVGAGKATGAKGRPATRAGAAGAARATGAQKPAAGKVAAAAGAGKATAGKRPGAGKVGAGAGGVGKATGPEERRR